jgi:hypothetical protein
MDFEQIKRVVFDLERMGVEGTPQFALARLACEDLAYSAFGLTDFGRASKGPELYTHDATQCMDGELLERAARLERYRKREANTARKTRHVISNFLFRLTDARTGYAVYLVQVFLEDDRTKKGVTPLVLADCGDQYVRQDNGTWRIAFRHLQSIAGQAH